MTDTQPTQSLPGPLGQALRAPEASGSLEAYTCPRCGAQDLSRIPRRPIDRLLALFADVKRFRCTQVECLWEGNLRRKKPVPPRFRVRP